MVWGAIGKNWRSPLIRVDGTLTSDGYIKLLQDNNIFESLDATYGPTHYYFEQDGAICHTAKKTIEWITEKNVNLIKKWPANSPDLSCIEQVWSILKVKIRNQRLTLNNDELYVVFQRAWYSLPEVTLNKLVAQTTARFELCV